MEELKYNLTDNHISVIRDALETQIGHLKDRLNYEGHIINDEEKDRLQHCIKMRLKALDLVLRILGTPGHDDAVIYVKR